MDFSTQRHLCARLYEYFGLRFVGLIALVVVNGILEGLAMALLFPLLARMGIGDTGASNPLAEAVDGALSAIGVPATLPGIAAVIVLTFSVQYAIFLWQSWMNATIQNGYVLRERRRLLAALLRADWRFFVNARAAEMSNSIVHEPLRAGGAVNLLVQIISIALVTLGYLVIAFLSSARITLILLAIALSIVLLTQRLVRRGREVGARLTKANEELVGWTNEVLGGAKLIKATAAESYVTGKFQGVLGRIYDLNVWAAFNPNLLRGVFEFIAVLALMGMLLISLEVLAVDVTTVLVVTALFVRMYPRFSLLQQNLQLLNVYLPAVDYLASLEARAEAAAESAPAQPQETQVAAQGASVSLTDLRVEIGEQVILSDVSLEIPAGSTVGIVGPSGAGKTTLIDCLLRLVEPDGGRVMVNGVDLASLDLATWRSQVGYVAQETIIFNASIEENIAWSNRDVDQQAIRSAARLAHADEFIDAMPDGYATEVGDRGIRLSGGQRQRIGLARALVGKKSVLVFDEATSALDSASEAQIVDALDSLHGSMTVITVAHRLSTLRNADRIHVLDQGRLVESGTWDELRSSDTQFRELWRLQSSRDA